MTESGSEAGEELWVPTAEEVVSISSVRGCLQSFFSTLFMLLLSNVVAADAAVVVGVGEVVAESSSDSSIRSGSLVFMF